MFVLQFVGIDDWDRAVFRSDGGRWLKSEELVPAHTDPATWTAEERKRLLDSLYTTDEFDGEPGWPVKLKEDAITVYFGWDEDPKHHLHGGIRKLRVRETTVRERI